VVTESYRKVLTSATLSHVSFILVLLLLVAAANFLSKANRRSSFEGESFLHAELLRNCASWTLASDKCNLLSANTPRLLLHGWKVIRNR
jgi:hypothetical protein